MTNHLLEKERQYHKKLMSTTGDIEYHVRLNPDIIDSAVWRKCTAEEYFATKFNKQFGGMIQAKTVLKFFDEDLIQEI